MVHYIGCSLYHLTTSTLVETSWNLFTFVQLIFDTFQVTTGLETQWHITQCVFFTTSSMLETYRNLFTLTFSSSECHKIIFVWLEPQWYKHSVLSLSLNHLLVVGNLPQLIHLNLFSLVYANNIRHISSYKMIFVGLEPQWYITQRVVFTTRPLAHFCQLSATYATKLFL
jgi:hypothetical protein